MIKIENVETYGWEAAIRGMRNPKNSWDLSDSSFDDECHNKDYEGGCENCEYFAGFNRMCKPCIGQNDLTLMRGLAHAGPDHGKFLRMITITMDITAPLYWWKEFDTYKVGTVANSCSTMHKIHAKEFEIDDFSWEMLDPICYGHLLEIIAVLNDNRKWFLDSKNKGYWWNMIQLLPSSYNQKRTVQLNYQVLKNIYVGRVNHKLDEWCSFCEWMEGLPYFKEVCVNYG